jgi:hypothetical protein
MQAASCWELLFKACTTSRLFDTGCVKNKKVTFHKEAAPKASSTENMTILPHEGTGSLSLHTVLTNPTLKQMCILI